MPSGRNKDLQPQQSHTMLTPDITKSGISWEEMGILSQMLNIPETYHTDEREAEKTLCAERADTENGTSIKCKQTRTA